MPKPVYKHNGVPLRKGVPSRKAKGSAKPGSASGSEGKSEMLMRTEAWMVEGIREPSLLQEAIARETPRLSVSLTDCKRWLNEILNKWQIEGAKGESSRARGEALASIAHLLRVLWREYRSIPPFKFKDRAKLYPLLMDAMERHDQLRGVTNGAPNVESNGGGEIIHRIRDQEEMCEMAGRFADLVAKRRRMMAENGTQTNTPKIHPES